MQMITHIFLLLFFFLVNTVFWRYFHANTMKLNNVSKHWYSKISSTIPALRNILVAFTLAILYTILVNLTHKSMWMYLGILADIIKLFYIKTVQIHILTVICSVLYHPSSQLMGKQELVLQISSKRGIFELKYYL